MNLLPSCILYFHIYFSASAVVESSVITETKTDILKINLMDGITTTTATARKINDKHIKSFLKKVLETAKSLNTNTQHNTTIKSIQINKTEENNTSSSGGSKHIRIKLKKHVDNTQQNGTTRTVHTNTTEGNKTRPLSIHRYVKNRPERYIGANTNISILCPYFVNGGGFNIKKMPSVYWPRFYNMNETLKCFKIGIKKLSDEEMKENEKIYSIFKDRVDWKQCHFEIIPQNLVSMRRHFLLGGATDMGVMRNILIRTDENGVPSLEEESPDQWIMLKDLILLRDCVTGHVVLFTKSPKSTSRTDVIKVLQELGEEMKGHLVCHKSDRLLRNEPV